MFIGYGLTETAPLLTIHPPGAGHLDTVGKPIDGVELRIDPSAHPGEEEASNGQPTNAAQTQGEVQARGPNVFAGYHNLPDKTAKTFTADGWFRTGDLGDLDDDGYLHITGRTSTLIVTPLRCRLFMVGTRFCASAARPNAEHTALERQRLPLPLTAFQRDPAKKSTLERIVTPGGENIQPDTVEATYEEDPVIDEIGVLQQEGQLVAVIVPDMRAIRERDGDIDDAIREGADSAD
jgi:long-chain acyl-CoA synthetase